MGAYQMMVVEFKSKAARDWFETSLPKYIGKPRRMFQYDYLKDGFGLECCYYMGWDGYGLGQEVLRAARKAKMKKYIKKLITMDLTTQSSWWDEIKEERWVEK